jgi:hypothetical protein
MRDNKSIHSPSFEHMNLHSQMTSRDSHSLAGIGLGVTGSYRGFIFNCDSHLQYSSIPP